MHSVNDITSYDITGKGFDKKIENKVRVCHLNYLSYVNDKLLREKGIEIYVSLKSSWRPTWWEKLKNRSGRGEHSYGYLGATDITCDSFPENWKTLLEYLIKYTSYTRLAVYHTVRPDGSKGGFIHGDYKNEPNDAFVYNSKWARQYPMNRDL